MQVVDSEPDIARPTDETKLLHFIRPELTVLVRCPGSLVAQLRAGRRVVIEHV